jgi:uncharacterized protein with PIN domain
VWPGVRFSSAIEGFVVYRATVVLRDRLARFLPKALRADRLECTWAEKRSVKDLLESYGIPHTEIGCIKVGEQDVGFSYHVADGDYVEVYGVAAFRKSDGPRSLQPAVHDAPRFVCDVHVEKLARRLRLLGFDVLFNNDRAGDAVAALAESESRILLTRDRRLLMRNTVTLGMHVWNDDPDEQVLEVLGKLAAFDWPEPFGRCTVCNGQLRSIEPDTPAYAEAIAEAPPRVRAWRTEFDRCTRCKKLYWKGTHFEKLRAMVNRYRSACGRASI